MKKNITFVINKAELVKYIIDSCGLSGSLISSHNNASISFNEYTEQITVTIEDKEDNYNY